MNVYTSNIETTNKLLSVYFDGSKRSFLCEFLQYEFENKSCTIKLGIIDVLDQSCNIKSEIRNSSDNTLVDTVTVSIPTLSTSESEFCFIAIGNTANFSIAIEGTFILKGNYI